MMKKLLLLVAIIATTTFYGQTTLFDGSTDTSVVFSNGFVQGNAYGTNAPSGIVMDDGSGSNNIINIIRTTTTPLGWHLVGVNDASHTPLTGFAITAGNDFTKLSLRTTKNTDGNIEFKLGNTGQSVLASYTGNGDGAGGFGPWQDVVFDFSPHIGSGWNTRIDIIIDGLDPYTQNETFEIDNILHGDNTLSNKKLQSFNIKLYPNPAKNHIEISDYQDYKSVFIYNLIGQEVKQLTSERTIDVSDLTSGIYILKTDTGATSKFVKQ
ncbi:T9SS type A sorting domain-containing protein [Seonamhaeicola maritimus]|uniref:T9SS type A sorting domain-containing protein n=1 Tax=Seonamhaeicola maritimus TaxID=2591822 RepID=UPI00249514D3|nr:T9SS type A sorting domain-containing protein [Seonamhaeicola maritimus]